MNTEFVIEPGRHDLSATRFFDAPAAFVLKAHLDPEAIRRWWGPARFETTVETLEPRAGGRWRFVQRDTAGGTYAFHGVFHEVSAHRLVQTFEFEGAPGHVLLETLTLEETGGKTKLTAHSVFQSVAARDGMVGGGMQGGYNEGLDRLDTLLETWKVAA